MDIAAGLTAAGNAISIAKALKEIEKNHDVASHRAQVVDLLEKLTDMRLALVEAREEIADLRATLDKLETTRAEEKPLANGDGSYAFALNDNGELEGFPACPSCLAEKAKQIFLVQNGPVDAAKCPVCRTEFRPVTCYIAGGSTLVEQRAERRRQIQHEQDRQISAHYDRTSWMGR